MHYLSSPESFELLPGVPEGIKLLNEHEFKVIVVTNQSGIARGYFTEKILEKIHQRMTDDLRRYGAYETENRPKRKKYIEGGDTMRSAE